MKKNRLLLLIYIIVTGVFVSYYGGYISYALFYLGIIIPILSYMYLIYVYFRFRIYQLVERKTVLKGEQIPYHFILCNEDILTFTNIKVAFHDDFSSVCNLRPDCSYCLQPGDRFDYETTICCHYRGEYQIGAKKVTISDFLNLFTIHYDAPSPINAKVLPCIIHLEQLKFDTQAEGKNQKWNSSLTKNIPDIEVRNYEQGDSMKMIHWKSVAKQQKLVTRKFIDEPRTEILITMDLTPLDVDRLTKAMLEDKIIESAIAICDYYFRNKTPIRVCCDHGKLIQLIISDKKEFDHFYQYASDVTFRGRHQIYDIMKLGSIPNGNHIYHVIITHTLSGKVLAACNEEINLGNDVALIFIGEIYDSTLTDNIDKRIQYLHIGLNDDITQVLEG